MNKLQKSIIQNFHNPPAFAVGDVWSASGKKTGVFKYEGCEDMSLYASHHFLITELPKSEPKIVRCVELTRDIYLNDSKDIIIKEVDMIDSQNMFVLDRICLRDTDGPILKKDLLVYIGTVSEPKVKQVLASLKKGTGEYNPVQEEFFAEILENLQAFRERVWAECL